MDILSFTSAFGAASTGINCKNSEMFKLKYYYSDIIGELFNYPVFMNSTDNKYTYMYLYRVVTDNQGTKSYLVGKYDWYVETGVLYELTTFDIGQAIYDIVAFADRVLVSTATGFI